MNGPFQVAQANVATQTSGKSPARIVKVTKPFGEQSVVVPLSYDGSVKADLSSIAGENITLVHLGEKLIILFDNKSTVTLEPFFDANGAPLHDLTVEVSPGRDLTGTEFTALFPVTEDRSILPAAGDGNGPGAQASGANFTSVTVDALAAPNPLDLLPQEDLPTFTINTLLRQNDFINGIPSAGRTGIVALDEDEIPGAFGNAGGPNDIDAPHTVSGKLNGSFGLDGPGNIVFGTASQVINGITITFKWNEATHTLTANDGSGDVFQVVVNPTNGDYTVTLLGPLHHHTDASADNTEASDTFDLTYTFTDSNGTPATGTLTLEINDDTPVAHDSAPTDTTIVVGGEGSEGGNGQVVPQFTTIDDEGQVRGNAGGDADGNANGDDAGQATSVSGKLDIAPGADGLKAVTFTGDDGQPHVSVVGAGNVPTTLQVIFVDQAGHAGLPEDVKLVWQADGNGGGKLMGISEHFPADHPAFTLTVDAEGNYTFDVSAPFVHPVTTDGSEGSIGFEDNIQVQFSYTATDGDGDKSSATLTFNIDDDTPTVVVTDARGDGGQQGLLVSLDETIGADRGPNGTPDGERDDTGNTQPGNGQPIGRAVIAAGDDENHGGLQSLFHVSTSAGADGEKSIAYSYALSLTGSATRGEGEEQSGGVATTLKVTDPAGTHADDTIYLFQVDATHIVGRVGGEDGAIAITITLSDANDLSGGQLVVEQYLPIDHSGDSNDFDSTKLLELIGDDASLGVTLTTTITDGDGDQATDSATVVLADNHSGSIGFQDDGPAIDPAQNSSLRDWTLDEDVLPGGNDQSDNPTDDNDYTVLSDKPLGVNWGTDGAKALTFVTTGDHPPTDAHPVITVTDQNGQPVTGELSSGGVALTYAITTSDDGVQTLTAYKGDDHSPSNVIFTMTLDPDAGTSGTFSFELKGPLDHPAGDGENTLNLNFGFNATDGDNDTAQSSITIRVTDDVPVVASDSTNYITNGDFQEGNWSTPAWWGSVAGQNDVPGWSISGDPSLPPTSIQFERPLDGYLGVHPSSPGNMIDMGGSPGNYDLTQHIGANGTPHLVNGQQYVLELEVGAPFPTTAKMEVWWNGTLIGVIDTTAQGQMEKFAFIVTGSGNPETDKLEFKEVGEGTAPIDRSVDGHPLQGEGYHGTYIANVKMFALNGVVDEDALNNDNAHGIGDSQPGDGPDGTAIGGNVTVGGTLGVKWGSDEADVKDVNGIQDGATGGALTGRSLTFTDSNVTVVGVNTLTSNGEAIVFASVDNNTKLVGFVDNDGNGTFGAGDRLVLDVTLSDDDSGSFKFTLYDNLDHAPGASENDIALQFNFTATDSDGDSAKGTFAVGVDDDAPTIPATTTQRAGVQDDALPGGHAEAGDTKTATGTLSHDFGADAQGGHLSWLNPTLPTGGYSSEIHDNTIDVYQMQDNGKVLVFSVELNPETGDYEVTQHAAIHHPNGNGEQGEGFDLNYRVTDGDGDYVDSFLRVVVGDDTPTIPATTTQRAGVQDDALPGGHLEAGDTKTATGTLSHDFGADSHGHLSWLNPTLPTGGYSSEIHDNTIDVYQMQDNGKVLVFSVELNPETGDYEVTQHAAIHHPNGNGEQGEGFDLNYRVTDGDGDYVDSFLRVVVGDDTPTIPATTTQRAGVQDDALPGGHLEAGDTKTATGTLSHDFGADSHGHLSWLNPTLPTGGYSSEIHDNTIDVYQMQDNGKVLVFSVELNPETGDYEVTQHAAIHHPNGNGEQGEGFDLNYRVTDGDGDYVDSFLRVVVGDDTPTIPATTTQRAGVQDDALPGGHLEAGDTKTATGTLSHDFGADSHGHLSWLNPTLPTGGYSSEIHDNTIDVYQMQDNGKVLVFSVELNPETGDYEVTQHAAIHHPNGNGEQGEGFDLNYRVTDGDGDYVDSFLRVVVGDDVPHSVVTATGVTLVIDETAGIDSTTSNDVGVANIPPAFAGLGTPIEIARSSGPIVSSSGGYGADGQGHSAGGAAIAPVYALSVAFSGVDSGLTTIDGNKIYLYEKNGLIVGLEGSSAAANPNGAVVFAISLDNATGVATIAEYIAIHHGDASTPNDSVSIADGALQVTVTLTDGDGDQVTSAPVSIGSQISFLDDGPSISGQISVSVDEDNISNLLSQGSSPNIWNGDTELLTGAAKITGSLASLVKFGADGPDHGGFSFDTQSKVVAYMESLHLSSKESALSEHGKELNYYIVGNTLFAVEPSGLETNIVFTLTLHSDGSYEFRLLDDLVHAPGQDQNTLGIDFGNIIVATDGDGDSVSLGDHFQIKIIDDVPTAVTHGPQNVAEGASVHGTLDFTAGADGAAVTQINGQELHFGQGGNGYSQWIDIDGGSIKVKADGSYIFQADDSVNNTHGAVAVDATFTVTDGDGDTSTAHVGFNIKDANKPTGGETYAAVDDDGLPGGNPNSTAGDINANQGDDPSDTSEATFTGKLMGDMGHDGAGAFSFANLNNATGNIGSEIVKYTWADNVLTATVTRGARTGTVLFTVEVTDPETGAYHVTLKDNVLHSGGNNNENADPTAPTASLTYTVTDSDGSQTTGHLHITFNDDAPTAHSDVNDVQSGDTVIGNVITNDAAGADGFKSIAWSNVSSDGTLHGDHGTLIVGADGSYTYVANPNTSGTDVFSYTMTDADGDTSQTTLTITVDNGQPHPVAETNKVDEAALDTTQDDRQDPAPDDLAPSTHTGTTPTLGAETVSGSLTLNDPDTPHVTNISGAHESSSVGANGSVTVHGEYGVLKIDADGHYVYTLTSNAQHDAGNAAPVDVFTYTVTDSHGNTSDSTITIEIKDDGPIASDYTGGHFAEGGAAQDIGDAVTVLKINAGADGLNGGALSSAVTFSTGDHGGKVTIDGAGHLIYTTPDHITSATSVTETFTYTVTDGDGTTVTRQITFGVDDTGIASVSADNTVVDEDDISTGNNDHAAGDNVADASGHISYTLGADAVKSIELSADMTGLTKLDGTPIHTTWDAGTQTLIGYGGNDAGDVVFKIVVSDKNDTGANYEVTLLQPIQHPDHADPSTSGSTSFEDNKDLTVTATVTDTDGSQKTTTFTVSIDDDSPVIQSPEDKSTSEAGVSPATPSTVHGSLNIHFGADGPGKPGAPASSGTPHTIDFNDAANGTLPGNTYTHDGFSVHTNQGIANVVDSHGVQHGIQMYGTNITVANNGNEPFTISQIDLGLFGGSATVQDNVVRLTGIDAHTNAPIVVTINMVALINLGGATTAFSLADTLLNGVSLSLLKIETVTGNGSSFNGSVVVDNIVLNSGSAPLTHGAVSFTDLDAAVHNITIQDSAHHDVAPATLTSHGAQVHYALLDSMTLVGYTGDKAPTAVDGANVVFSVVLSQDASHPNGGYDFTLRQPLDNLTSGGSELDFTFSFTAKDGDGDAVNGHFTVDVKDDVPVAHDDANSVTEGLDHHVSGNVYAGGTAGHVADAIGADGPAKNGAVTGAYLGHEDNAGSAAITMLTNGSALIHGHYGDLELHSDGSYTYTLTSASIPDNVTSETFTYRIEDGDGDADFAQLEISLQQDEHIPTVTSDAQTVYEDGLADGQPHGADSETHAGSFKVDAHGEAFTLKIGGTDVTSTALANASSTNIQIQTDHGMLTITGYEPATGTVNYSYTLGGPLQHSAQGEDQLTETISLAVTDATGDHSTAGQIVITVVDDTPVIDIVDPTSATVDEGHTLDGKWTLAPGADGVTQIEVTVGDETRTLILAPGTETQSINLDAGKLTVDADGDWHFAANQVSTDTQVSFTLKATDGDGDHSSDSQTITIHDVNKPLEVQAVALGAVEEEHGLPGGIDDTNTGTSDLDQDTDGHLDHTTNVLTGSFTDAAHNPVTGGGEGNLTFGLAELPSSVSDRAVETGSGDPLTSGGKQVYFAIDDDGHLIGYVNGTSGGTGYGTGDTKVFTFELQSDGDYTFTLNAPVDHPGGNNGENTLDINLNDRVTVTDSAGPGTDTKAIDVSVSVIDDKPVAHEGAAVATEGAKPTVNAVLVLDLSLSMGSASGDPTGHGDNIDTRLELMQAAVQNFLNSTTVTFNQITIYTFSDGAQYVGQYTVGENNYIQNAIDKVNSFNQNSLKAATDYDEAVNLVGKSTGNGYSNLSHPPADTTNIYFLSDGDPTSHEGLSSGEQSAWDSFLNTHIDQVYAIGFSGVANTNYLVQIASRAGTDVAKAVTDPNKLSGTLSGALPSGADGNVLDDTGHGAGGFGADGGHVQSITVDGDTYGYTSGGSTHVDVTTTLGGKLTFYFVDDGVHHAGDYSYTAPTSVNGDKQEDIHYVLVDRDGDTAESDLLITVKDIPNAPPHVALNETGPSGTVSDDFSSGYSGGAGWGSGHNWTEENDSSGASGGNIKISSAALTFGKNTTDDAAISRHVDLSGHSSATVSFDYTVTKANNAGDITIQVWNNHTNSWDSIGTIDGSTSATNAHFSYTLTSDEIGANSGIRFVADGKFTGSEVISIDNINIDFSTVVSSDNHTASFTENGAAISIAAAGPTITDTDDNTMASAKIVLTNAKPGDILDVSGLPTGIDAHIDTSVAGQITVNLSGHASLADYQTAIEAVTYQNTSDNPGSDDRTIHVTVTDDHGNSSNVATTTVHVTPTNDAPTTNDVSVSANEGASSVELHLTGSDVDGTVKSFKISGLPSGVTLYTDSTFQHAIGNGDTVSASDDSATVYFKPASDDANGKVTFQYAAIDNDGAADGTPATATINITPVNDAPSGADKTFLIATGGSQAFSASDFGFSDTHDNPSPNSLKSVIITTLPEDGKLTLNGHAVAAGQEIGVGDIGKLEYTADADESSRASFTFQVKDNGGTDNGGVDTDQSPNTITFDIDTSPVIYSPSDMQYVPSSSDQNTLFNRLMFADADTTGSVTVRIQLTDGDGKLSASGKPEGGSATWSSDDDTMVLTGTIAAINAWLATNHLTLNTDDNENAEFKVSISDGTSTTSITSFDVDPYKYSDDNGSGDNSSNNLAGMNVHVSSINGDDGNDTVYTSWSHVGSSATTYNGGDDSDTIYLNMTGAQLQEILAGSSTRNALQAFLTDADNDLNLANTSWHASAKNFEHAHIELANLFSTTDSSTPSNNYIDIESTWGSVLTSTETTGMTGTNSANFVIANLAGILDGKDGDDVLVARTAGNELHGGDGSDLLLGGSGADILQGDGGKDVLSGGAGADIFRWGTEQAGTSNADKILDYNFNEGDTLDLSKLLDAHFDGSKSVSDFVQVQTASNGHDLVVSVDTTGNHNFGTGTETYTLVGLATNGADPVKIYFEGHDHVVTG